MATTKAEAYREMEERVSKLQGTALELRSALDESRAAQRRSARMVKKQRAYIDALVGAAREHGLSVSKDVTRQLNDIAGSDDTVISVSLRKTHTGWAREGVGRGQGFIERAADARRVIDWSTGKPPVTEEEL